MVTSPYGARLVSINVPDKHGKLADVIQGFDTMKEYQQKSKSQGAICGRVANRIANAQFTLNGEQFQLSKNIGENTLHGGEQGFSSRTFTLEKEEKQKVVYSYQSPHLENGFPGNLAVKITYEFTDDNEVKITLQASTDQPTPVNLTSHPYFNLKGEGNGLILDHLFKIYSNLLIPTDTESIPTGELMPTKDTVFDFREFAPIEERISDGHKQIQQVKGFDHSYILNDYGEGKLKLDVQVREQTTGRQLNVYSDYPAIQFYTANTLDTIGKANKPYKPYSSFCLEPQYYPDSPNQPDFPDTILKPGEEYNHQIIYQFEIFDTV